jgi:predicted metal-dependent enzyme (double-stranded beta helix superfamily)
MPTTSVISLTTDAASRTRPSRDAQTSHPAGQGLVEAPEAALPFAALRVIASGLARVQEPIPLDTAAGDPDSARSLRLLATSAYDVWLITWPDGAALGPHDHGGARSVVQVVDGEIVEIVGDRSSSGAGPRARVLRRGESSGRGSSDVHELANWSGADATTLHIYSPPLADVSFADHRSPGEPVQWRRRPVAGRVPQASTRDAYPTLTVVDH